MNIPDFSKIKVLVVGDVMLDRYWHGNVDRISPEAPVPIVKTNYIDDRIGGAGNVAFNLAELGATVTLLSIIGNDDHADALKKITNDIRVNTDFINDSNVQTICKLRVMSQHQQLIRIDFDEPIINFDKQLMLSKYKQYLDTHDVIIFSDYGKGTLCDIAQYITLAHDKGVVTLVDPKGNDYTRYTNVDFITPNVKELQIIVPNLFNNLHSNVQEVLTKYNIGNILLTRGEDGMSLIDNNHEYYLPAQAKSVYDVTGAGDTVIAVFALCIASKLSKCDSAKIANIAASVVVGKLGTSTVTTNELIDAMANIE